MSKCSHCIPCISFKCYLFSYNVCSILVDLLRHSNAKLFYWAESAIDIFNFVATLCFYKKKTQTAESGMSALHASID